MPETKSRPSAGAKELAERIVRNYRTEIHFGEKDGPCSANDPSNAKWLNERVRHEAPKLAATIDTPLADLMQIARAVADSKGTAGFELLARTLAPWEPEP